MFAATSSNFANKVNIWTINHWTVEIDSLKFRR
jgi:hypothetical protein